MVDSHIKIYTTKRKIIHLLFLSHSSAEHNKSVIIIRAVRVPVTSCEMTHAFTNLYQTRLYHYSAKMSFFIEER